MTKSMGGLQPISRHTDNHAAMYNCWLTKGANERSFVFVHQHGGGMASLVWSCDMRSFEELRNSQRELTLASNFCRLIMCFIRPTGE